MMHIPPERFNPEPLPSRPYTLRKLLEFLLVVAIAFTLWCCAAWLMGYLAYLLVD